MTATTSTRSLRTSLSVSHSRSPTLMPVRSVTPSVVAPADAVAFAVVLTVERTAVPALTSGFGD